MSVFIPGMKMPKKGFVTVDILSDGRVLLYNTDTVFKAVEIPTPHGRLIDADALCRIDGKDEEGFSCQIVYDWDIEEAPTIIEAEGERE